jgi:nicotinate-nucleotide adenylyltransferase
MNKRVGIYAGTFDPIHEGHLAFAKQALQTSTLDKIFFLVEPRPRRKQGVRALEHREAMVRLAVADNPCLGIIQLEHSNFTVEETLPKLQALFEGAELHFLMGEDVFAHLNAWPNVNELLASSSFII